MDSNSHVGENVRQTSHPWYKVCLEIPLFLHFFAFSVSESVLSNLILYKTCTVTFNYNETICSKVLINHDDNATKEIEEIIQQHASSIIMYKGLLEGVFPAIISLFLGPWSDKNGRKPLIIASLFGYFTFFLIVTGYTLFDNLEPTYIIIAVIPYSILGGSPSLITGCFCYISDITSEANRSFKMAILEGGLLCGVLIGSFCSSYMFQIFNYVGIFLLCAGLMFIGITYCLLVIKESVNNTNAEYSHFLDCSLIVEMFKTCYKPRSNYRRLIIWLCMLASSFGIFVMQGDNVVLYLFTRERLNWNLKTFTIYAAFSIITSIVGILIIAFLFQKCLKLSDGVISIISYLSNIVRSVMITFVNESWQMYFSAAISTLRAVSGPINRAILTKVVPPVEAGKVLSLTTSLETIIPLISSPLYANIYKRTISTFPGAFNLISAALYGVCLLLIGVVEFLLRKYPVQNNYTNIQNPDVEDTDDEVHATPVLT